MPAGVVLDTDLPVPGPAVNGNANELQLLVANLVTNAWEALGDLGGTIRLAVRTVPSAAIPTSHRVPAGWKPRDAPYACIEVTDPGCGIEVEEIESIFDPFYTS